MINLKMESTMKLIVVSLVLKVISTQRLPSAKRIPKVFSPQCRQSTPLEHLYNCCEIPDLFEIETNAGCSDMLRITEPSVRGTPECAERTCLLRNNDLLFDNDDVDNESVKHYLNQWVSRRKEFQAAVNSVKERCAGGKPLFGPVEMCPADKLLFCIESNFYNKCPDWKNTEGCRSLRAYMEACMPYYD